MGKQYQLKIALFLRLQVNCITYDKLCRWYYMNTQLQKGLQVLQRDGLFTFIRKSSKHIYGVYLTRLPLLGSPNYNGVNVRRAHLPWESSDKPYYESALVNGIENCVHPGDTVVIVGGGYGVTAVRAAKKVGKEGKVVVFEGSKTQVRKTRETAQLNRIDETIEVHHRIVGPAKSVYGDNNEEQVESVQAKDLPECDVLELDCEGAEIEILSDLSEQPRAILVETHGVYDAPADQVRALLEKNSYEIISQEIAEKNKEKVCMENGIHVLLAKRL